jgi:excinuclease ABC subunit C
MKSQDLAKFNLPEEPGVYFFKKGVGILYIGKATSLRDRVKSYFSKDILDTRGVLIADMVWQADRIDFIQTDSVLEALILEANLIKKHQPKYNTMEKDDKSYNYVVITKEEFPKVLVERGTSINFARKTLPGIKLTDIFGPFVNGGQLKEAMKIVRRIFPFLDNNSKIKTGYGFYREIGLAPEIGSAEAKRDYRKTVGNIKLFFKGKKKSILAALEKEMKSLAKVQQFEKADEVKRRIFALEHIQDIALLKKDFDSADNWGETTLEKKVFRIEAYDIAHISGTNTVGVMVVMTNGRPDKNQYRKFKIRLSSQNDIAGLEEVLRRRLNHPEWRFPDIIAVDGSTAQKNIAEKILAEAKLAIPVIAVTKNEKHRPESMQGREELIEKYKKEILLGNAEAHRFAIKYHREKRSRLY